MSKELVEYLDKKFNKIDEELGDIREEFRGKFDKVLDGQDKVLKRLDDLKQENDVSTELYKKHEKKIENHGERIFALEAKS